MECLLNYLFVFSSQNEYMVWKRGDQLWLESEKTYTEKLLLCPFGVLLILW